MRRWLIDSLATGGLELVVLDAVVKATFLLCITTAIAAVLRRSAAAVRHRLWGLTLCGLIVLPLLSWSLPGWRLPILPTMMRLPGARASLDGREAELAAAQAVDAGSSEGIPSTQPSFDHDRPGDRIDSSGLASRSSPVIRSLVAPRAAT